MKPIIERTRLSSHRNYSNPEMLRYTFGKNGLPPLHAVDAVPPTKKPKVIADAIMARSPSLDSVGIDMVLRRGINSDVDILAVEHEIELANLDE